MYEHAADINDLEAGLLTVIDASHGLHQIVDKWEVDKLAQPNDLLDLGAGILWKNMQLNCRGNCCK